MGDTVRIVDHNSQRATLYMDERCRILKVIGNTIAGIEHTGSTAVPGLGAKPIVDTMVAVPHLSEAKKCIKPL